MLPMIRFLPTLKRMLPFMVIAAALMAVLYALHNAESSGYKRCIVETSSKTKEVYEEAYDAQTKLIRSMPRDIDAVLNRLREGTFNQNPN